MAIGVEVFLGQARSQQIRHVRRVAQSGLREDGAKLLAAVATDFVAGAQSLLQNQADSSQHVVTARVTVLVVDALEVIDIDHEQRQLAAVASRAGNLLSQN